MSDPRPTLADLVNQILGHSPGEGWMVSPDRCATCHAVWPCAVQQLRAALAEDAAEPAPVADDEREWTRADHDARTDRLRPLADHLRVGHDVLPDERRYRDTWLHIALLAEEWFRAPVAEARPESAQIGDLIEAIKNQDPRACGACGETCQGGHSCPALLTAFERGREQGLAEARLESDALAAMQRVRDLWGGSKTPPILIGDTKVVRASVRRRDLGATVTESFLRLDDVVAALAAPDGGMSESGAHRG